MFLPWVANGQSSPDFSGTWTQVGSYIDAWAEVPAYTLFGCGLCLWIGCSALSVSDALVSIISFAAAILSILYHVFSVRAAKRALMKIRRAAGRK